MHSSYKWAVVGMLWFVCFFNYADRQAIFSVFPLLKKEMGLSDIQLGLVGSAFMYVYALSGPFAGITGDKFSRKTLILGSLLFWSAITLCTAFAQNYWHLVVIRALEGFGEAFYFPAALSLVADYHGKDTRSRALALHQSSVYAGTIAGGAVSGYMGEHYGWQSSFYCFGGLGILLAIVLWTLLKEPVRGASEPEMSGHSGTLIGQGSLSEILRGAFQSRMVPVLIITFMGANFVASIFLSWMPSFLYTKFHMSLSLAGFSATAYQQLASVLGVLTSGYLADRAAQKYPGGRMMIQAFGLILGAPFIFLTGWTLEVPVLILAMVCFGFFKGMYDANIWASLYDVVKPQWRSSASGIMNSLAWLGGATAPIAIAYASESYGMSASISSASVIYLLVGLFLLINAWRYSARSVGQRRAL
jgi:MFS family permease